MKYLYYALFHMDGDGISIEFPDLPGCLSCGKDMSEALYMAKDVLEGWLVLCEDDKEEISTPSTAKQITIPENALLVPIEVDTKLARIKFNNKAVKKTLTIPYQLNELAEQAGLNFSQVLQKALRDQLNLD